MRKEILMPQIPEETLDFIIKDLRAFIEAKIPKGYSVNVQKEHCRMLRTNTFRPHHRSERG